MRGNCDKSDVFRPRRAKFLGYTFAEKTGRTLVHPKSFKRLKDKLRAVFCRARGGSLLRTNGELNAILCGWRQYFRLDNRKGVFEALDIHIRRHLRKLVWIAWKRPRTRERELHRRGLDGFRAWESANNGRGAWWNANARHMRDAFPSNDMDYTAFSRCAESPSTTNSETAGCRTACPNAQH